MRLSEPGLRDRLPVAFGIALGLPISLALWGLLIFGLSGLV